MPFGGGEERQLALLLCDMREFTPFVERHPAHDVIHIINRFFTAVGEAILLNDGLICQYVGDEITGPFGVETASAERCCLAGVRAGLGMLAALDRLNIDLRAEFNTELRIGVGPHFGSVLVGRVGHPSWEEFAVVVAEAWRGFIDSILHLMSHGAVG